MAKDNGILSRLISILTNIGTPVDTDISTDIKNVQTDLNNPNQYKADSTLTKQNAIIADTEDIQTKVNKIPLSDGSVVWNSTAQTIIQTKAAAALTAYDPPTRAEATSDKDEILAGQGGGGGVGDISAQLATDTTWVATVDIADSGVLTGIAGSISAFTAASTVRFQVTIDGSFIYQNNGFFDFEAIGNTQSLSINIPFATSLKVEFKILAAAKGSCFCLTSWNVT